MDKQKLEDLATKASQKVLQSMKNNHDPETEDSFDEISFGQSTAPIEEIAEFDIFDFCENEFVKKGDFVQYTIKKNGATVGFKKHPYSWEKIQKEFGGGRFNIFAKSMLTGRIVKRQSMPVEDEMIDDKKESGMGFNPSDMVAQIAEAVRPKNEGPNFMELFTMMNSQQEKSRLESERASERAKQESDKSTSNLIQIMQQNTLMMLEMMKGNKKEDSSTVMMQMMQNFSEKMDARFERMLDKIQNSQGKKPEFGLMEVLKLQQDSQDKGFKLYSQLNNLAETKAEQKIELIENYKSENSGTKEKKSMTDTLIETMLPTIAGALAKSAVPAEVPVKQAIARPTPRPVLRPQPVQQTAKAQQPRPTTQAKPAQQTTQRNSIGLPSTKFNEPKKEVIKEETKIIVPEVVLEEVTTTLEQRYLNHVKEYLIPVLVEHLMEQTDTLTTARSVETCLIQNGSSRKEFVETVTLDGIMSLVSTFELPKEVNPWFEDIYANLKNESLASNGQHA